MSNEGAALKPAPSPATYTRPLQDNIKYVQYIPKDARGNIEDAVNQLYKDPEPGLDLLQRRKNEAIVQASKGGKNSPRGG